MGEDHFLHLIDVDHKVAEKIYERHCFFTEQPIAAGVAPRIAETNACWTEHIIIDESFCLRLAAGLTTNMIANMGRGKNISMETLVRICEALNCGILDVIELEDDKKE